MFINIRKTQDYEISNKSINGVQRNFSSARKVLCEFENIVLHLYSDTDTFSQALSVAKITNKNMHDIPGRSTTFSNVWFIYSKTNP